MPLDERSARRRDLYLTTPKAHKRKASMSLSGFEPAILESERLQTQALDRAASRIGPSIGAIRVSFSSSAISYTTIRFDKYIYLV